MKFVKKPIAQRVEFARIDGVLQTMEGNVAYKIGDAIVTGVLGERWPVRREVFDKTYEACEGATFGETGLFRKKKIPVSANQTSMPQQVEISGGQILHASSGDWIVQDDNGKRWVVSKEVFEKSYEPLNPDAS